jgi:hypothetical protein
MERAPLGFCLMLRTPPGTPATHVRPRPGSEHEPGTMPSILLEPPINAFTPMRATSRRKPVRSSPRPRPRDGTSGASALPLSFAPHRHRQRTSGRGQAIEHGPGTTLYDIRRTSDLACSLNACDLASHGDEQVRGDLPTETRFRVRASLRPGVMTAGVRDRPHGRWRRGCCLCIS